MGNAEKASSGTLGMGAPASANSAALVQEIRPPYIALAIEQGHLATYQELFVHRSDIHSRQNPNGSYYLKREPVTDDLIRSHLEGQITAGFYGLRQDGTTRWVALDADQRDGLERLQDSWHQLNARGIPSHLELSRRGGHLWILFEPIAASAARRLILSALPHLEGIEVFPKQDRLVSGQVGSAMRGPLGIHRITGRRYDLVDAISLTPVSATTSGTIEALAEAPRLGAGQVATQLARLLEEAMAPPRAERRPLRFRPYTRNGVMDAESVKERIGDLRGFVGQYVDLDTAGRGSCPFHPPDRRKSFAVRDDYWVCFHEVNPRTGRYLGGDAIAFYMRLKGLPFRDALEEMSGSPTWMDQERVSNG
jgi:hypothetical protein